MNLREIRARAGTSWFDRDPYDHVCAGQLRDLLIKLRNIVQNKFKEKEWSEDVFKYFEDLGCEIKISEIAFKGDADHIPVQIQRVGSKRGQTSIIVYQVSVPVECAEKILVIGV